MALTRMKYTPETGLKDKEKFPATPVSEDAAREQFQRLFDQVKAQVNALMAALESAQSSFSGARNIGCESITYLDEGGTTVWSQLEALSAKIYGAVDNGEGLNLNDYISEKGIKTLMLDDKAVTTDKIADTNVTTAKLEDGCVTPIKLGEMTDITFAKRTDGVAGASDMLHYNYDSRKVFMLFNDCENDAHLVPVKYGTEATTTGIYPPGTLYVQYVE